MKETCNNSAAGTTTKPTIFIIQHFLRRILWRQVNAIASSNVEQRRVIDVGLEGSVGGR